MTHIVLRIDGDVCGVTSVGTVAVIRALERCLGLSLSAATEVVNRCVFEGEQVKVPAPTRAAAEALLIQFQTLPAAARIRAELTSQ